MTFLVERLRHYTICEYDMRICYEAAEEIERMHKRIEAADRVILTLTEEHNSASGYVRGFEQAREYFAKYAEDTT